MTTKKGSTARPSKGKADTEEIDMLAHHLSETLRIMGASEAIPARVYNNFAEGFNDLMNLVNGDEFLHSEAHVRMYLRELARKEGAK